MEKGDCMGARGQEDTKHPIVWGEAAHLPPSVKRIDPRGWLFASVALGALAFVGTLALVWRPLPLMSLPIGTLGQHASHWAEMAVHALLPALFERPSAIYAQFWAAMPNDEKAGVACRLAMAVFAAIVPGALLAGPMLEARDELVELRGTKRIEGARAAKALSAAVAKGVARRPGPEIAPGVAYPRELYARHVLVVGGVGSGKSTFLRPLVDQIAKAGEQILLFDAKSEFTAAYPDMALIAPWDARSLAWDIAADMRNVLDMERFAEAVVRESSDPMWASSARQVLVGCMLSLQGRSGEDWGWAELAAKLSLDLPSMFLLLKRWHPIAADAFARLTGTAIGIMVNLRAYCSPVLHMAKAWGGHPPERRFSVVEWTMGRSKIKQLILQGHGGYPGLAKACAEGILGTFASLIASIEMADDLERKLWFVADEFAQLGEAPVTQLFAMGRGRGLACVAAMQDFAQLETLYGPSESKALIGLCGTIVVGQTMVGDTAKALCDAFGTREVERRNVSTQGSERGQSASVSFTREEVPIYKPSELSSRLGLLPDGSGSRLILFTKGVAYELIWPVFDMPVLRKPHVLAAWLKRPAKPSGIALSSPSSPPPSPSPSAPDPDAVAGPDAHDGPDVPDGPDAVDGPDAADKPAEGGLESSASEDDGWPFTEPDSTQATPRGAR